MGVSEIGQLYFSQDAAISGQGLYALDTSTGAATFVGINDAMSQNVGLAPSDSSSLLYGSDPNGLLTMNVDGSGTNSVGNNSFNGLAYDATNDLIYGTDGGGFYIVNRHTGNPLLTLASPFTSLQGLAFGNGGVYGLGSNQDLLFYDPSADNWSSVGNTGQSWLDVGLAFDASKNVLYAKGSGDTLLYEIDGFTAETTVIGGTGIMEGGGLAMVSSGDRFYEEPNDTLSRATHTGLTLTNHGTFKYSGEIGDNTNVLPEDDVDFFKFDLDLGEAVRLPATIELLDESGNPIFANAEVQVFDSTGMSVPLSPDDDPNYVIYQADQAGTFYVGISGNGNTSYDPNAEGSGFAGTPGNYNLTIETIGREMGGFETSKLYFSQDAAFNGEGLYTLDTSTGAATFVGINDNNIGANVGLAPSNSSNVLYGTEPYSLLTINADGSGSSSVGSEYINGLAYDATNNILYGVDGFDFYTVNQNTGNQNSLLASPFTSLQGLAFGNGGVYGLGSNQDLLFYDPSTDNWSAIGDTGQSWQDAGLAFDADQNVLYAKRSNDTLLYEIDVSTALPTVIGDTGIMDGGGLALVSDIPVYEEPNDTFVRAVHTGLTRSNPGTFTYSGEIGDNTNLPADYDVDFFKFDLDLGETVRLPATIELLDESGNPIFADAEVQMFDSTGMLLPLYPDDDPNYVIYQADAAGTFYIGISGDGNITYDLNTEGSGSAGTPGNYNLTIETIGREMGGYDISNLYFSLDAAFNGEGLYTLDTTTGDPTLVGTNDSTGLNVGLAPSDSLNILYGSDPNGLLTINADGSGTNSVGIEQINGLAYDATNDILYGADGFDFYTVDPNTGNQILSLASPSTPLQGLAFGNDGVYGLGSSQDLLFYDPSTDNWSVIGNTGQSWPDAGLAFDAEKNVLYAKQGGDTSLYEINVSTAVATVIGDTGILDGGGLALVSDRIYEEPNDTLVRAISTGLTLTNPGTFAYSGEIGDNTNLLPEDDVDLFKFDLDAGETVRLPATIELLDDDGNPMFANAELQVFDSTGTSISLTPDGPDHVIYQPLQTGTFYVGISGNGNTSYDPNTEGSGTGSAAGNYNLTIETTSSRIEDETNDILAEALDTGLTLTNPGIFNYSGEIGDNTNLLPENDVDLFKFDLDIGEEVKFSESIQLLDENGNPIGAARVQLFDANGLFLNTSEDPEGSGFNDRIYRAETGAETLYIGVSGLMTTYDPSTDSVGSNGMPTEVGSYDLTIETVGRTLGVDETNDILGEAVDTGLTLTNSGIFNYSGEIGDNTNLLPENDVDLFKFDLDIGEEVKFSESIQLLDENGNPIGAARVQLFDANGLFLNTSEDPEGSGFNDRIYRAETGAETLYIGVSGLMTTYDPSTDSVGSNGMLTEVGSYDLTIETTGDSSMTKINEIRIDQTSTDNDEYFELFGTPGESLDNLTYLVIGDDGGGSSGVIEAVIDLTGQSIPASGFFLAAENTFTQGTPDLTTSLDFENEDNVTHLLVEGFTGSNGDDLDADDDGVLDVTPWTSIVDSVALIEAVGSGEEVYSTNTVGPDASSLGHVFRSIDGGGTWEIGDFSVGIDDTPGATNDPPTVETFTPADNDAGVAVDANLVIDFDEDVQAGSGNITLKKASDNSSVAATVSFTADTVTIDPDSDLAEGTEYYVEIDAGAIENTAGNDYAGISGSTAWNFTTASTDTVISGADNKLYDGTTGEFPNNENATANGQWLAHESLRTVAPFDEPNVQSIITNATRLDTTSDNAIYAGYSNYNDVDDNPLTAPTVPNDLVNANFPTLDNTQGYMVNFTIQVNSESNNGDDYNTDGKNDRAGFSAIVVSDTTSKAIELSFETDRIWAQDVTGTSTTDLVQAEGVSLDTTQKRDYNVKVSGDTYTLFADGTPILSGDLRDYTGVNLGNLPNPYQTANGIFFGDRNDDASAQVDIYDVSVTTPTTGNNSEPVKFDFNGDGTRDLLWRHSNGELRVWLMENGDLQTPVALPDRESAWTVESVANFDSDADSDILWKHTDGRARLWVMENGDLQTSVTLPDRNGWTVEGVADFDGDSDSDILWRNASGEVRAWVMENGDLQTPVTLPDRESGWTVEKVTNFDSDSDNDILWKHTDGRVRVWLMENGDLQAPVALPDLAPLLGIENVSDFDGDGDDDILLRYDDGRVRTWRIENGDIQEGFFLPDRTSSWQLEQVSNFDSDSDNDVLWRNSSDGRVRLWQFENADFASNNLLADRDSNWELVQSEFLG